MNRKIDKSCQLSKACSTLCSCDRSTYRVPLLPFSHCSPRLHTLLGYLKGGNAHFKSPLKRSILSVIFSALFRCNYCPHCKINLITKTAGVKIHGVYLFVTVTLLDGWRATVTKLQFFMNMFRIPINGLQQLLQVKKAV